jgi:basic membrane protein A
MSRAAKVMAVAGIVAAIAGSCSKTHTSTLGPPVKIGLMYEAGGIGDKAFNDAASDGLARAEKEFNISVKAFEPGAAGDDAAPLEVLSTQGYTLNVAIGGSSAPAVASTALQFPSIKYVSIDGFIDHTTCDGCVDLTAGSNAASVSFADEQGSYLMGAAAALKSKAAHIGFMGTAPGPNMDRLLAGYEAGAAKVAPSIKVDVKYSQDAAKVKNVVLAMYGDGADVVFDAGGFRDSVFDAALEHSTSSDTHVWAIGFGSDRYLSAAPNLQPYILTSLVKRVDEAVYDTIRDFVGGKFQGGYLTLGLAEDGLSYATSGDFLGDIQGKLDGLKQDIIAGKLVVPTALPS